MASTSISVSARDEEAKNVLQTLASIKAQISSVLGVLQRAHLSAAAAAASAGAEAAAPDSSDSTVTMSKSTREPGSGLTAEEATPTAIAADKKDLGQELSRDEVKAQREAAKAAKAARKKKGGVEAPMPEGAAAAVTPKNITPKEKKAQTPTQKQEKGSNPPKNVEKSPALTAKVESSPSPKPKPSTIAPSSSTVSTTAAAPPTGPSPTKEPATVPPTPAPVDAIPSVEKSPTKVPPTFDSLVEKVNPQFRELGLKYSNHILRGSNSRTKALLTTTKSYILNSHRTPEGKGFKQDLSAQLQIHFQALKLYRPFAVGMTSAIDGMNEAIRSLPEEGLSDTEYREELETWVDTFIEEKITKAVEAIAQKAGDKIANGDTILIYSLTEALYETFKLAGEHGKRFNLILALTRPRCKAHNYLLEYTQLRESLGSDIIKNGQVNISCINLSSIMSFLPRVDKVFLGGHALFTTGGVMAHAGASTVALCAGSHNIPVIFFCETYKFCDKSPTDAFYSDVFPENTFGFSSHHKDGGGEGEKIGDGPTESRIIYDVTPVNLVTCVITDIDMLPSSSVPVVLRVQETRPLIKCL